MGVMNKIVMQKFYRKAEGCPERLPWHLEEPSKLLVAAVEAHDSAGHALDVGCGAGVQSVWLAERGLNVTGLDLFPEAIDMARARASGRGLSIEFICDSLFSYSPDRRFELVLDSGCLHSLVGGSIARYKQQLLHWLVPGGEYVLWHWGKRHAFDWWPCGPMRRSPAVILRLFAPEFETIETEVVDFAVPFPLCPKVRGIGYRFVRRL